MIFSYLLNMQSHPSWVCGLKQVNNATKPQEKPSHPSWVCGLKLLYARPIWFHSSVTPFVGVWIETL